MYIHIYIFVHIYIYMYIYMCMFTTYNILLHYCIFILSNNSLSLFLSLALSLVIYVYILTYCLLFHFTIAFYLSSIGTPCKNNRHFGSSKHSLKKASLKSSNSRGVHTSARASGNAVFFTLYGRSSANMNI